MRLGAKSAGYRDNRHRTVRKFHLASGSMEVAGFKETASGSDALSSMGWFIGVTFALVIGFGYAVRKRKRMRSRGYYHGD
jgi:hypothetical protein